jgi:hypothetical protein
MAVLLVVVVPNSGDRRSSVPASCDVGCRRVKSDGWLRLVSTDP